MGRISRDRSGYPGTVPCFMLEREPIKRTGRTFRSGPCNCIVPPKVNQLLLNTVLSARKLPALLNSMSNSSTSFPIIAIDGGAAVGKSSTSRALADRLDLMHVDTGAHYRTLTHALLAQGVSPEDDPAGTLDGLKLATRLNGRTAWLSVDDRVPSDQEIRSPAVNAAVSKFAAIPEVRQALFEYQRSLAKVAREEGFAGLIMEGRDIGSIIFPDADRRFFLEADEATRAARRAKEGQTDAIADRDKMDKARKTAPLICPEGAIRVDTGPRTLEEVVEYIVRLIEVT